jgi:hypothetical protein
MHEALVLALRRKRARLNAAIALHRALAWAAPSAAASGILVAAALALGLPGAGYPLWAGLCLAGAIAGAFASRKSFMSEEGAARWLDSRLGGDETLAAAVACARSGSEGRFDSEIASKAEALLPRAASLRPPAAPSAKRGGIAALACLIGAYAIFLAGSPSASMGGADAKGRSRNPLGLDGKAATAAAAIEEGGPAAAKFASELFPGDKRMAMLTERALREGRIDDLRELLKAAGLDIDSKLAGKLADAERKKLAAERERLGDASNSLSMAMSAIAAAKGGEPGSPGEGGAAEGGAGEGGGSASDPRPKGSSPNAASGGGEGADGGGKGGGEGGGPGNAGGAGRGGPGYGSGSGSEGDWGGIKPSSGKDSVTLPSPKDPSYFELVLPGSESSSPISAMAASRRRSAEAAIKREDLPREYEDFVRSYFLTLSKGESR